MTIDEQIGPRKVGGRYHCAQWDRPYTVLQIERNRPVWPIWQITIRWDDTQEVVSHCTAWDPDRDRVLTPNSVWQEGTTSVNCANQSCGREIRRGERYVAIDQHIEVAVKPTLIERIRGRNDIRRVEDAELVAAFHPACAPR